MFEQVFTDAVMFGVSLATFCAVSLFLVAFLRRDHWQSIWWLLCLAYLIPHTLVMFGYYVLWQLPDSPILLFPIVAAVTRPGIIGIYAFVLLTLYILYRKTDNAQHGVH